jgi:hypothetical protein
MMMMAVIIIQLNLFLIYLRANLTAQRPITQVSTSKKKEKTAPSTQWIGGSVGPRVGLDAVEKGKFCSVGKRTLAVQLVAHSYTD